MIMIAKGSCSTIEDVLRDASCLFGCSRTYVQRALKRNAPCLKAELCESACNNTRSSFGVRSYYSVNENCCAWRNAPGNPNLSTKDKEQCAACTNPCKAIKQLIEMGYGQ